MSSRICPTRIATAVFAVTATLAVLAAAIIGLTGWPPAAAFAGPDAGGALFVSTESTRFGPEVAVDEKFDSLVTSATSEMTVTALLLPSAKAAAPAPKKAAKALKARKATRRSSSGWQSARVSWYGPGFYGQTMAGGGQLTPTSMVCAHRSLAFGTRVTFKYKGKSVTAVVQDRGPYVSGRAFDLGPGTAKALGFSGVGTVQYRILGR